MIESHSGHRTYCCTECKFNWDQWAYDCRLVGAMSSCPLCGVWLNPASAAISSEKDRKTYAEERQRNTTGKYNSWYTIPKGRSRTTGLSDPDEGVSLPPDFGDGAARNGESICVYDVATR